MKLSDLVTEENMGKVKVTYYGWHTASFFIPCYRTVDDYWYGLDERGNSARFNNEKTEFWSPYTEPPKTKKVVLYQWWNSEHQALSSYLVEKHTDKPMPGWTKIESTRLEIQVPE